MIFCHESMEWTLVYILIYILSNVKETNPTHGVCQVYRRIQNGGSYRNVRLEVCCNHFYRSNGVCTECPTGFYSKNGGGCKKCANELYGKKCRWVCRCNKTERCDHVKGCVPKDDIERSTPYVTEEKSDDVVISITSREIIIVVIIMSISLLVFLGLFYVCRKRQRRIFVTPIQNKDIQADNVRQHIEESNEGVYDEIDESAMSTAKQSLQSSYLDVIDSPRDTMIIKGNPISLSAATFSSHQIRLRHSLDEHLFDLDRQSSVINEYSDGYLRPKVIAKHNSIDIMLNDQGTLFSNKNKVIKRENRGPIYDSPSYDGISRSVSYDRLFLANNVGIIDRGKVHLDNISSQPKCKALASKRKTV